MKAFWQFILDGRFSEGLHNLASTAGYAAMIEVYLADAHHNGFDVPKTLCFAALVCGIPTAQAAYAKWLRAPADPQADKPGEAS